MLDREIFELVVNELLVNTWITVCAIAALLTIIQMIFDFIETIKTMEYDKDGN